ncbi:MAG: hypothetical protein WAV47_25070 [Blastocatellia bacterium]
MEKSSEGVSRQVVLLVHGIRTHAQWQEMVVEKLARDGVIDVKPIHYGYFDLFRFWCPTLTRSSPLRKLEREIQDAKTRYGDAKLSIIAHSFGTYAVTRVLYNNPNLKIYRLILCGSVVSEDFDWGRIKSQIEEAIINDCGSRDAWPVLAKSTTWGYGSSGTYGFGKTWVEDRYHNLSHSEFFEEKFVENYWKPYIDSGSFTKSTRVPSPWWFWWLSLPWKYLSVSLALALVVAIASGLIAGSECEITREGLREDFTNLENWTNTSGWLLEKASTEHQTGRVYLEKSPPLGFAKDRCYGDFRLAFNLKLENGEGAAWALRVQKDASKYFLFYLSGSERKFYTYLVEGDKLSRQKDPEPVLTEIKTGCSYNILALVTNAKITHSITAVDTGTDADGRDRELGNFSRADKLPTHGSIGFRTVGSEKFSVDNVIVDSLDGPGR